MMYQGDEYLSDKYGLTPYYAEDKVDGSDIVVVDWSELKDMLKWLESNYEIGIGRNG